MAIGDGVCRVGLDGMSCAMNVPKIDFWYLCKVSLFYFVRVKTVVSTNLTCTLAQSRTIGLRCPMTLCELVIFGVTCGARRYDRTNCYSSTQHCSCTPNAERPGWLVSLSLSLSLSRTLHVLFLPSLSHYPHSRHSQPDALAGSRLF
jgi:hypothetical protein